MHHKRGRPKNRRAGCLWCKPHKANGAKGRRTSQPLSERRSRASAGAQLEELRSPSCKPRHGRRRGTF